MVSYKKRALDLGKSKFDLGILLLILSEAP